MPKGWLLRPVAGVGIAKLQGGTLPEHVGTYSFLDVRSRSNTARR